MVWVGLLHCFVVTLCFCRFLDVQLSAVFLCFSLVILLVYL